MGNPIKALSVKERVFWIICLLIVAASNFISKDFSFLTLTAALIGVSAVLFGAKGNVWGQILIAVFSVFYGVISWQYHYWSEVVTYMGMAFPMALWAVYTWTMNVKDGGKKEVEISEISLKQAVILAVAAVIVTIGFYKLFVFLDTPNIVFSTLSVTTSFLAAALSALRSSYYLLWYSLNDLILIILWILASIEEPIYWSVVVNFSVFLINDFYGFISWKKREKIQFGRKENGSV